MNRKVLHIVFWIVYLIQDTLLHYTWMTDVLGNLSFNRQLLLALSTAFLLLPPKLMVVYYFILYGLKKVMYKKVNLLLVVEFILIFIASIFIFRAISYCITMPFVYQMSPGNDFMNAKIFIVLLLELGYIVGIAITFKLMRLQVISIQKEKNLTKEKLETELKFLRNQTNPHFLFNTLNNIYALARKKSDKTPEVVMKLSELLSFMLYRSNRESIPIEEEILMIEDYLDLQRIRFDNRLSIQFDKEIDDAAQTIAPLLLLPLVENSFKHGVSETRNNSFVSIDIKLNKGNLNYTIENSIEDSNYSDGEFKKNIGLKNTKRQLELIYKEFDLNIESDNKTYKVNICINLNSYGKV